MEHRHIEMFGRLDGSSLNFYEASEVSNTAPFSLEQWASERIQNNIYPGIPRCGDYRLGEQNISAAEYMVGLETVLID